MGLTVRNEEARHLAEELSALTGESVSVVVTAALRERLDRERRKRSRPGVADGLMELGRRYAALPDRDTRTAEDIIGYDEHGLPT